MPFPLAHPAAVLPFRRFCPRHLSFAALLMGSIVPDLAYAMDDLNKFSATVAFSLGRWAENLIYVREAWDWDDFSHSWIGSILFDLPVALVLFAVYLALRSALTTLLPNPHRVALRPLCAQPAPGFRSIVGSLLIGIWLHVGWDYFTNGDRWAGPWGVLHFQLFAVGSNHLEVYRGIWWCSTLGGMAALLIAYRHFLGRRELPLWSFRREEAKYYGLWLVMLLLSAVIAAPLTLRFIQPGPSLRDLFGFIHRFSGYFLTSLCSMIALLALYRKIISRSESQPRAANDRQ